MNGFKEKVMWILGALLVLVSTYFFGKKAGKNGEQAKTNEKLAKQAKTSRDTYNLSFSDLVERMQEYGDK